MTKRSALHSILFASLFGVSSVAITAQATTIGAFDITGEWQVQPAAAGSAPGTPCMLSNQYDNGFGVNLSGGQDQILVMAVDFKQNIFDQAQSYETGLSVDSGFQSDIEGKPFNASTLIYNLKDTDGIFEAFEGAQSMTLDVSGNALSFSLKNISAGLQALNTCAGEALPAPIEIQDAKAPAETTSEDLAEIAPAAGETEEQSETKTAWVQDKPKEVYIRRQKKPMPNPLAWLKKSDSEDSAKVAAIEPAAGEADGQDIAEVRPPEPIDLLKQGKLDAQVESEPVKAVQIEAPILQGDEPVLVSRADEPMPLERPDTVALFEKESEAVAETIAAVARPAPAPVTPAVPEAKPEKEVVVAANAPLPPAQKEMATKIPETVLGEPVARLAKPLPPVTNEPYEPIHMPAYEPIVNTPDIIAAAEESVQQKTQDVATNAAAAVSNAPPMDIVKPAPGIKVASPRPPMENMPSKSELLAMLEAAEARIQRPEAQDVLAASEDSSAIPIQTTRSKDIFVSRPLADVASNSVQGEPQTWSAKAGEDIKIVLARWAERADMDLVWDATHEGQIAQNINAQGDINAAVQMLLSQNAPNLSLEGNVEVASVEAQNRPQLLRASAPQGVKWNASSGTSLRTLFEEWSVREGFKLLWNSDRDYSVNRSVSMNGELEAALTSVLSQFDAETVRPVGQLNIDPVSNQKTLVIETERVL